MTSLEDILQYHFGYSSFRPGQKEVIEQILQGRDVLAMLPTGMGKSLCYQLPAYIFNKPVLIISPLLSLMQDQVEQIKAFGEKRVIAFNSFLPYAERKRAIEKLNQYRFIFLSPEMLAQEEIQKRIKQVNLSLIVVDEAHCISQWGFDFRPDYLKIGELLHSENRPPILALTATATKNVMEDIKTYLKMKEPFEYIHSVNRPNIHFHKIMFPYRDDKLQWIIEHVKTTEGPGIIYTQSRDKTEKIAESLLQQNIAVASYHGGKDAEDRQFIQQQFILGQIDWIVATNAFGMGVHKSNIRQIIHETLPSSMENYMQEVGRAGRDGKDALAILLYCDDDEQNAMFVAIEDIPTSEQIKMYDYLKTQQVSPDSMYRDGYISETSFRVLHYWMTQMASSEVESLFQNMKYNKIESVNKVTNLIHSNRCMRELIVEHFGQKLQDKPKHCCTSCGIEIMDIIKDRQHEYENNNSYQTWERRLQMLLIN